MKPFKATRHPRVEMRLFFGSQGPVSELTISHGVLNLFFFFAGFCNIQRISKDLHSGASHAPTKWLRTVHIRCAKLFKPKSLGSRARLIYKTPP